MLKLTDVIYGLALYHVLLSVIILIGSAKFWKRLEFNNQWLVFIYAGLYVFGAICTGITLDMVYASGARYGIYAEIIKIMFEMLAIVAPILKLFAGKKVRDYIRTHFRLDAFLFCSMILGFGCLVSYILLHSRIFI